MKMWNVGSKKKKRLLGITILSLYTAQLVSCGELSDNKTRAEMKSQAPQPTLLLA